MQQPPIPANSAEARRRPWREPRVYALLLGLLVVATLTALRPAAAAAATPGAVTGSFSVPAGTASPTDVNVTLVSTSGYYADSTSGVATGTTTGTYSLTDETPGQYYVYFSDTTSGDNVQSDYYGDGGSDDIQKATLITIPAGGTTTVGTQTLSGGATISGAISDANQSSETSGNATVEIDPVYTGANLDPQFYKYETVTGAGSYSISGLPVGTYRVEYFANGTSNGVNYGFDVYVDGSGVTYDADSASQYSIAAGSTTTANVTVGAVGAVSGTVSGPSGPVSDDQVQLYDGLNDVVTTAYTATDGTYTALVLPGAYKVNFGALAPQNLASTWYGGSTEAAATAVNVGAGANVTGINATLASGATISGTVSSGQGAATLGGIYVSLLDAQGNDIENVFSQPNGSYTLTNVPAGTWYIEFNGGIADNGQYYGTEFYGGTQSQFGAAGVTTAAGQAVSGINGVMLPASTTPIGLPKESAGALSGLHNDKVALRFKLAAGKGAGYLQELAVGLPKGFSWNRKKLKADLSLGKGVTFAYAIKAGKLVVVLSSGQPSLSFSIKAGGITVTKKIEKAAGGSTKTKATKKKKHALALAAKAKKKTTKAKDTIKSETINLAVADTTGAVTSLAFVVKKPH